MVQQTALCDNVGPVVCVPKGQQSQAACPGPEIVLGCPHMLPCHVHPCIDAETLRRTLLASGRYLWLQSPQASPAGIEAQQPAVPAAQLRQRPEVWRALRALHAVYEVGQAEHPSAAPSLSVL